MDGAIVVFSRKGLFKTTITAGDIRSREHARKLWPLVSPGIETRRVTWVSQSKGENPRRSHFRLLPSLHTFNPKDHFNEEECIRWRTAQESLEHQRAKQLIADELFRRLQAGLALPWSFIDPDASDFPLKGNLLLGANQVQVEYSVTTPFGCSFRLDVAVLGPPIHSKGMLLGGIEIEFNHEFDGRKALITKSLAFPLISIDITEMTLAELTPVWAERVLSATTKNHEQGRRQTYVYLHDLMYPVYAQIPDSLDSVKRHQFLIFSDNETLRKMVRLFNFLAEKLGYPNGAIVPSLVNGKSEQSRKVLERLGQIVGPDWRDYNAQCCLLLSLPRPQGVIDINSFRLHMAVMHVLLSKTDSLVGYKYTIGLDNLHPEEDIWFASSWDPDQKIHHKHRVLPKRLAEPINRLLKVISNLNLQHNTVHE